MSKPFRYGEFDCGLFVAEWIRQAIDIDYAVELRGKYHTRFGAARTLYRVTGGNLFDFCNARFKSVDITMAQRGDIVFTQGATGICDGINSWFVQQIGISSHPTLQCDHAWQVE